MTSSQQINWIAFRTIVTKEIRRFTRIWVQTIVPPAISALLYLTIFGTLIGRRVGEMDGHPYINFIVPGIIMMAIITNSYANTVSSFFSAKFQRHLEELLIAPVHNVVILAGFVTGGVARGLLVGTLVAVVALFFTDLQVQRPFLTLSIVVLTSILFATGGVVNAVFAKSFDDVSVIPHFVLTPLTYLGGIFYSVKLLPDLWETVSYANPVLYMINGFRYGILGVSDIDIFWSILVILVFIIALGYCALNLLNRGIGIKQ